MPIYEYRRSDNGELIEVEMTISEMKQRQREDENGQYIVTGKPAVKAYREYNTPSRGQLSSTYPMKSETMGCHPSQVKEFEAHSRKMGVPTHFTKDGRPILTSKEHRKKYAESRGFFDRNGGYSDPQRKGN